MSNDLMFVGAVFLVWPLGSQLFNTAFQLHEVGQACFTMQFFWQQTITNNDFHLTNLYVI